MRFYTQPHRYYGGVDLHARPEAFLQVVAPYRQDLAVAAECLFS